MGHSCCIKHAINLQYRKCFLCCRFMMCFNFWSLNIGPFLFDHLILHLKLLQLFWALWPNAFFSVSGSATAILDLYWDHLLYKPCLFVQWDSQVKILKQKRCVFHRRNLVRPRARDQVISQYNKKSPIQ